MIRETLEQNNGNQKAMFSRHTKRTKRARVTQRAKATKFFHKKLNKLKMQIKARLRIDWEQQKALNDKLAKL